MATATTKRSTTKKPAAKKAAVKRSTTKKSAAKKPTVEKSAAKRSTTKKPTTKKPTTKKVAATTRPTKASAADTVLRQLREFGLAYPGAHTKSPWPGHLDLAVNDKTFAYLSIEGEPFKISCKLPASAEVALLLPFCKPTAYGLGKSGWVSAEFPEGKAPPLEMLKEWVDESYRAQAPRTLVKQLEAGGAATSSRPQRTKRS